VGVPVCPPRRIKEDLNQKGLKPVARIGSASVNRIKEDLNQKGLKQPALDDSLGVLELKRT